MGVSGYHANRSLLRCEAIVSRVSKEVKLRPIPLVKAAASLRAVERMYAVHSVKAELTSAARAERGAGGGWFSVIAMGQLLAYYFYTVLLVKSIFIWEMRATLWPISLLHLSKQLI